MELTLDDVRQLALELWLAQRENVELRAANTELKRRLNEVTHDSDQPDQQ